MNGRHQRLRVLTLLALLSAVTDIGSSTISAQTRQSFPFRGQVVRVNLADRTVVVKNERVPGWMEPMTMTYGIEKSAILKTLKVGDQITARVFTGDLTLYDVQVVPKKSPQAARSRR